MRIWHFLKYYLHDLRKQKKRAGLTVLALVWGTFSILMLLAFGEGLTRQLDKARLGLGDNIMIVWGGQTSITHQGLPRGRKIWMRPDDDKLLERLIPEIKHAGGEYHRWGVDLIRGKTVLSQHVTGIPPSFEEMRTHYPSAGGRMINQADLDMRRRVMYLGYELKQKLFGDEDPVGRLVELRGIPFTVIGYGQDKMQMGMYSGPDVDKASIPVTTFKAIFGDQYFDNMVIQVYNTDQSEYVKRRVYEVLGAKYKFSPDDEDALGIWDTVEGMKQFNAMMLGIQIFLGIVGGMTLLIAGVGVANIMYVVVKERTREIGIKMATGAKRRHIMNQFMLEALLVCFTGGAAGILISALACYLLGLIPVNSGNDAMNWLGRPTISTTIGVIVASILAVIGIFSGLFPARKAAGTNPVESLRYE
jgi:putative ABC transport system permease protein